MIKWMGLLGGDYATDGVLGDLDSVSVSFVLDISSRGFDGRRERREISFVQICAPGLPSCTHFNSLLC